MGRLPLVCHILKPQQLPHSVRLSARSASARPRPRAAPRLRVTRGTCRAQLRAIQSRSLLVQISGAEAIADPNHRRIQPRRAAGPLPGARVGSARTAVRDPLREPPRTRSPTTSSIRPAAKILPAPELARDQERTRAALDLVVTPEARPREIDQTDRRRTAAPRDRSGSS